MLNKTRCVGSNICDLMEESVVIRSAVRSDYFSQVFHFATERIYVNVRHNGDYLPKQRGPFVT